MCEVHGLAVGDDGRCVLCRRAEDPQGAHLPLLPILGAVAALIFVGLIVFAVIRYGGLGGNNAVAVAEPSTATWQDSAEEDEEAEGTERPRRRTPARMAGPRPTPTRATTEPTARPPEPSASVTDGSRGEAGQLEREQRDREAAIEKEMRRIDIKVYMTTWCPVCTKARVWLAANGYRFTEYDVDADRTARRRQRRLNPKGGVPTIDIEGQVLTGFSARKIERALRSRAERRLRR